jgi:hypothetical protein
MISAEAPMLFAKACEMFILELTLRSWYQTEESKRRTLQRSDVEDAVHGTEIFDFLIDTVPRQSASSGQPQQQKPTPVQPTQPPASAQVAPDAAGSAGTAEKAGSEPAANAQDSGSSAPEGDEDAGAGASSSEGAAVKTEDTAVTPSGDGSSGDSNNPGGEASG